MTARLLLELLIIVLLADLLLAPMAAVLLIAGIAFAPKPLGCWCKAVFRGGDYTLAALFGGDGKHSISAYCGRAMANDGPVALRVIGAAVDKVFGEGHCRGAAQREGLL